MDPLLDKLDHPAWFALTESHTHFAIGDDIFKRYQPHIVPFAAIAPGAEIVTTQLEQYTYPGESFFLIGDLPALPDTCTIENSLLCVQMICLDHPQGQPTAAIDTLGEQDETEMETLINLVQPGYYLAGTRLMGNYYGIRQNGALVAITGERMRLKSFTEISAVVTHPAFTGRGYAKQLVAHAVKEAFCAGTIPFLHVAATNTRAIGIYEGLGFTERRKISFHRIKREPS